MQPRRVKVQPTPIERMMMSMTETITADSEARVKLLHAVTADERPGVKSIVRVIVVFMMENVQYPINM